MRNFTLLVSFLFLTWSAIGQSGWTEVDSGLDGGQGVGQISVGMNDNTALWGLAVNTSGNILDAFTRSTDGGNTWEAGTFNEGNGLSQLFAIDADVCWALFNTGATQGLYKTVDGGATWVKKGGVYGASSFANVMHFFDDMNGFAQGDAVDGYFELYTTTDGGEIWTRVPEADIPAQIESDEWGITGNYYAVGDHIWYGTNKGRIFRSTDKGYTWDVSETTLLGGDGGPATVNNIMFDQMNGIAYKSYLDVGFEEQFNVTTDGGVTWTDLFPAGINYARYLYHVPGTDNTVIGSAGTPSGSGMGISISYDGGANWEVISEGFSFLASAWLDLETGWCGTEASSLRSSGGMYIYGNPPAPFGLEATVDVLDVMLTWSAPGAGTVEELIYDNGTATSAYSWDGYTLSTHMSPSGPCKVLAMKFFTTIDPGDNTYNASLFEWTGSEPGTDIIYQEPATAVEEDWMEVDISAQNIMFTGDFVVGFGSINETAFVGYDENLDNGRSWDFDNTAETWEAWNEAYLIRAIVEYEDGKVAEIGGSLSTQNTTVSRSFSKIAHPRGVTNIQTVDPISNRSVSELELLGYNVYRDGSKINSETVEIEEYTDTDVPIGSVEYYVTAVYDGGESDPSDTAFVIITGIYDNTENTLKLYPNPAYDVLTIESSQNIQLITITNSVGQMVFRNQIDAGRTRLNISEYQSGVYFVQIETDNGTTTQKIIIE